MIRLGGGVFFAVVSVTEGAAVSNLPAVPHGKRRRRPPSSKVEAARRVAWGKQWGAIMSAHAKTYRQRG